MTDGLIQEQIERYPDGKIPASRRYVDFEGQVIIRTHNSTYQRYKKSGWDVRRRGAAPYILHSDECRGEEYMDPMNPDVGPREFTVKYVGKGEKYRYEVVE